MPSLAVSLAAALAVLLAPGCAAAQSAPTKDQLHEMLVTASHRSQLEVEGAAPFHLKATVEWSEKGGMIHGTIDELWQDAEHHRTELTLPDHKEIDVRNGAPRWRTGVAASSAVFSKLQQAALTPMIDLERVTTRISEVEQLPGSPVADCIGTEPDIPGVSPDVLLAQTEYCLAKGNHLLLMVRRGYWELTLKNAVAFQSRFIAGDIDIRYQGRALGHLHVDSLVPATDFMAVTEPPPADAQVFTMQPGSHYSTGEVVIGYPINKPNALLSPDGREGTAKLKLHIDTTGAVTDASVVSSPSQFVANAALSAVRQMRFRVAYRGNTVVPADIDFTCVFLPAKR